MSAARAGTARTTLKAKNNALRRTVVRNRLIMRDESLDCPRLKTLKALDTDNFLVFMVDSPEQKTVAIDGVSADPTINNCHPGVGANRLVRASSARQHPPAFFSAGSAIADLRQS